MGRVGKTWAEKQQERLDAYAQFDPNASFTTAWGLSTPDQLFVAKARRAGIITKFGNVRVGKLWELTPSGWKLVGEKLALDDPKRPQRCDICSGSLIEHPRVYDYRSATCFFDMNMPMADYGRYDFARKNGKILSPLTVLLLCQTCARR